MKILFWKALRVNVKTSLEYIAFLMNNLSSKQSDFDIFQVKSFDSHKLTHFSYNKNINNE